MMKAQLTPVLGIEVGVNGRHVIVLDERDHLDPWISHLFHGYEGPAPAGWTETFGVRLQINASPYDPKRPPELTVWFDALLPYDGHSAFMHHDRKAAETALEGTP